MLIMVYNNIAQEFNLTHSYVCDKSHLMDEINVQKLKYQYATRRLRPFKILKYIT